MKVKDYLELSRRFGGGPETLDAWAQLRSVRGRAVEGWRFEVLNPHWPLPEVGWCFGLAGASRLVVMATPTELRLYDSDSEVEHRFTELIALVAWLDEHEHEHAGFTTVQTWLLDDSLRDHIERWSRESGDS